MPDIPAKPKEKGLKIILSDFRQALRSKTGLGALILNLFFGTLFLTQAVNPVLPDSISAFAQGQIGVPTLTLGNFSVHPVSAVVTNEGPVCLVLVAVEITGQTFRVSDGPIFLMANRRAYPTASIHVIGQDAPFGQKKTRALAFHPTELCKQGLFQLQDLALLVTHPNGVGVVSFAAPTKANTGK